MNMESLYEYGSRAGFWRLHRLFTERSMPCTVYACALALERNPEAAKVRFPTEKSCVSPIRRRNAIRRAPAARRTLTAGRWDACVQAMVTAGWEIASHGYRWWDYQHVDEATERDHISKAVEVQQRVVGTRPVGIYQGKPNANTLRLVVEEGGFLYNSDSYADDLPYWNTQYGRPILIIPYTLDNNDMRFAQALEGDRFFHYLKDTFDALYAEGETAPKMMSVGLHCRIVGRPGRSLGLARFLDYVRSKDRVWVCTRAEICDHWCPPRTVPRPAEAATAPRTSAGLARTRGAWWRFLGPTRPHRCR
jgi:peptidoglycan/xylan/chitin deacetylase (PgdA/CDA1 family)